MPENGNKKYSENVRCHCGSPEKCDKNDNKVLRHLKTCFRYFGTFLLPKRPLEGVAAKRLETALHRMSDVTVSDPAAAVGAGRRPIISRLFEPTEENT